MTLARNPRQYRGVRPINPPNVIYADRAPTTSDVSYVKGDLWLDETGLSSYQYISGGNWIALADALSGNPITPFVVGATGGYATVQAGIDAAEAAGGGLVFIQDGTYTEDLGFTGGVSIELWGSSAVEIIGNHTLPTSGALEIQGIKLTATSGAVFTSIAAGTTPLRFINVIADVTNGAFIDIANWTGDVYIEGVQDVSASSTYAFGAGDLLIKNSSIGTNAAGSNSISGDVQIFSSVLGGAITIDGSSSLTADSLTVNGQFLITDTSNAFFTDCSFTSGAVEAVNVAAGCTASLYNCIINSSDTDVIDGAGDLTYGLLTFVDSDGIAATLTITDPLPNKALSLDLQTYLGVRAQTVTDFAGSVTLVAGTATVLNTNIAAGDKIFFSISSVNGSTALGILTYTINAGVSFVVTSVQPGTPAATETNDVSILQYFIVRGT